MDAAKRVLVAGLAAVGALAGAPGVASAGWVTPSSCDVWFAPLFSTPANVCAPVVNLKAPIIRQDMPLDCESAALAVALQIKGHRLSQDWVFAQLPKDGRAALLSGGRPVRWGDPYTAFVGNVHGSETGYTGYGVYYGPIAAVAQRAGATADGHTGWTTSQIEDQIRKGNPVVIWVNSTFAYSRTSTWTAWDGRAIPYTVHEHAVTVVGFNTTAHTVTLVDVGVGRMRTMSEAAFASAIATFGGMAVAIS